MAFFPKIVQLQEIVAIFKNKERDKSQIIALFLFLLVSPKSLKDLFTNL